MTVVGGAPRPAHVATGVRQSRHWLQGYPDPCLGRPARRSGIGERSRSGPASRCGPLSCRHAPGTHAEVAFSRRRFRERLASKRRGHAWLCCDRDPAASDRSSERASGVPAAGSCVCASCVWVCAPCVCGCVCAMCVHEAVKLSQRTKTNVLICLQKGRFWCVQRVHGGIRRHGCRLHTRELSAINSLSQNWTWCVQETRLLASLSPPEFVLLQEAPHTRSAGVE